ncbi:MAG: hypothetical protein Aurels2KO_05840 [Aureliella sp.]
MKRISTCVVLALLALLAWYVLIYDSTSNVGQPDESERVFHPLGFSIIAPKGWEIAVNVDSIRVARTKYARHTDTIQICRGECNFLLIGDYKDVIFLGKPAKIRHEISEAGSYEHPAMTFVTVLLNYSDTTKTEDRIVIRIGLRGEYDTVTIWLQPFVDSIEFA